MNEIYPVPEEFKKTARTVEADYFTRYQKSIEDPDAFWADEARNVDWIKPFTQVKNSNYDAEQFKIEWFADGQLNVCANCLDRHLKEHPHKPAIIWEGDHPSRHKIISFKELYEEVCRFANVLKNMVFPKATVLYFICQWCLKQRLPCWHARELVRCTVWCLVAFRQTHWQVGLKTVRPNW